MKIVTRYLIHEVYTAMLASMVVLLAVFLSNILIRYMDFAASGALSGKAVKVALLLQIPILSPILLPTSLFMGILLAYGRLYADSEMTVLTICGMNPRCLLSINLVLASAVATLVAILSLWINPKIYKYSDHIKSGATSLALDVIKPDSFNSKITQDKWIFHIKSISRDKKKIYNVFAIKHPNNPLMIDQQTSYVLVAKSADIKDNHEIGESYIILKDGYRYAGIPGQQGYEITKYDEYGIKISQEAKEWYRDESSISTLELIRSQANSSSAAELQWRFSLPISTLILTLIGVPMSKIRSGRGRYTQLFPSILLYVVYANFLFLARAWIKRGILPLILGIWWVHGLMLILAIFLLGKQLGWWRIFGAKIQ
ncbi:MAG: LPS export ABC transporter permease LptF [Coxiellaceae bacterium]|jgi:lipopolysaccharide export system permease protein|nr:LPS export ABC transporter permease LptF [Coxiellaceae bacterium]